MIDKLLGKQSLIDDSGTPRPNIDGTLKRHLIREDLNVIQTSVPGS